MYPKELHTLFNNESEIWAEQKSVMEEEEKRQQQKADLAAETRNQPKPKPIKQQTARKTGQAKKNN